MSEIEKYYNGEIHVDFDDEIERLNNQLEKEKSRFKAVNNNTFLISNRLKEQQEENERLHSIIREVREYIDKFIKANYEDVFNQEQKEYMVKILQMLDKENKDGER